jgi:hypothetical protein
LIAFARAKVVEFEAMIVVVARMASKSIEIVNRRRKSNWRSLQNRHRLE